MEVLEYYNNFKKKLIGEGAYARFEHEYKLLSKYNHPNILKAYC